MDNGLTLDYIGLTLMATTMRKDILDMGLAAGGSGIHLGGSFSCVEILAALYGRVIRPGRDTFIFSKGHGAPALYSAMHYLGLVSDEELATFKQPNSFLTGHPSRNVDRGVEFASGSLGQGLSLGVGSVLGARQLSLDAGRVFVLMGDGECDEGSVWEAAMSAAHYGLRELVAIVDANALQYDGPTDTIMSLGDLAAKWTAFGWSVVEVDGHNFSELVPALETSTDAPLVVIAHTVKGKGASFAEGVSSWHNGRLTKKLYDQAIGEIESASGEALL